MTWVNVGVAAVGLIGNTMGAKEGLDSLDQGRQDIKDLPGNTPIDLSGAFGNSSSFTGRSNLNQGLQGAQGTLSQILPGLLAGGAAGGQGITNAVGAAGNSLAPAFQSSQSLLGQQAGTQAFGGLQGLFNQSSGLGNSFAQRAQAGPQDFSQGAFGNLLSGGQGLLSQAGNTSGLVQQNLDASRALAAPGEQNLINQFANREFSATRGATTGAANRQFDLQNSLALADNQRVMNAQQLGLQSQNQLGQLGLGQLGQAQGFLGQNLAQFGQDANLAQGFLGQAAGIEGQGFGQALGALQQNQTAGQQRLAQAQGLFGFGDQIFGNNFERGLGATEGLLGIGGLGLDASALPYQLQAALLQGSGAQANALGDMSTATAGAKGGLFGGLGDGVGDIIGGLFG